MFGYGTGMTESTVFAGLDSIMTGFEDLYRDVHEHPELSMQEYRTAGKAAERLEIAG
jgi:metal-dependent amidase/aminoacylase/carboxypeptidase family protein